MVEIPDIKDRNSLEAWLTDQPRNVSVWIAARAAARVLPVWWQAVLTEDWARERDLTVLPVLRSLMISSVAPHVPTDDIKRAYAESAAYAAHAAAESAAHATTDAYAAHAAAAAEGTTNAAAAAAAFDTDVRVNAFLTAVRTDAEQAAQGRLPDALPLWPDGQNPLEKEWSDIKARVADAPDADWQFWIDWYDAQLSGRTLLSEPKRTWDMLETIAVIAPDTWDAGPEVVNPRIREIWDLHRLRSEVAALQAQKETFLAARASHAQRSHNQPPEGLVDDQPEVARQITIVWDSLDEARDELEQDTPDKGRLHAIAERLGAALKAIVQYCGKVTDTVVISAAKVGGGAVGTAVLDHVVNNGRLMQFAKDLLTFSGG